MKVPKLLRVSQAAEEFEVHPSTVRDWIAKGLLPFSRTLGGQYRIDKADVAAVLKKQASTRQDDSLASVS